MLFLFAHRTRDIVAEDRVAHTICGSCGQVIQGVPVIREHAGWFVLVPYRIRVPYLVCPYCGFRNRVKKG